MKSAAAPEDIDAYIATKSPEIQAILQKVRLTIKKAAPNAKEAIRYGMPTFRLQGNLVHFAAFKKHIGFFPPVRSADANLKGELENYAGPKGNLRFPLDEPMPYGLITKVVKCRVKEDLERATQPGRKQRRNPRSSASS